MTLELCMQGGEKEALSGAASSGHVEWGDLPGGHLERSKRPGRLTVGKEAGLGAQGVGSKGRGTASPAALRERGPAPPRFPILHTLNLCPQELLPFLEPARF